MKEAIYLYGFVPLSSPVPEDLSGVADRVVELVELGPFAAAAGRVPAAEFEPETVRQRLQDLEWVAEQGVRHERVVTWFVDRATIVPARLLTLYSSPEALAEEAAAQGDRIQAQLRRLAGRREWDLKVSYEASRLRPHLAEFSEDLAELEERIAAAEPGTRYLLERKRASLLRESTLRVARRLAGEVLDAARRRALESRTLEPPAPTDDLPVVLTAALLVDRAAEEPLRADLEARAKTLETKGLRVALSGPWAPYRFLAEAEEGE